MIVQQNYAPLACAACANGAGLDFEFTMAFQPIINFTAKTIFAQEALVRGMHQESAADVLSRVNDGNRYRFDQACRVKAIELAASLNLQAYLSINFLPNAVYRPETCIRATLEAAHTYGFPQNRIIFEVTEGEQIKNKAHLVNIFQEYKRQGFKTAIDDFGAGYSGLNLLAEFQPDIIKLDMALIRNVNTDRVRRAIIIGIIGVCREIGCEVIAEGVETREELAALRDLGINLFQGYYFVKPSFQKLATVLPTAFNI